MKVAALVLGAMLLRPPAGADEHAGQSTAGEQNLHVVLLGTMAGPTFAQRLGIATLVLAGSVVPGSQQTRGRLITIAAHHTDGVELGRVLDRAKPKLAVVSHFNVDPAATLPLIRQNYAGRVEFGEDSMTIEVGNDVTIRRLGSSR